MNHTRLKRPIETGALTLLISFFAILAAHAHGEDSPGPNGGRIWMPGPYHTEVLARPDGFQVYLLDINFKNPTVSESEVKASLMTDGKVIHLECEAHSDHFFCSGPNIPRSGKLIIQSMRAAVRGSAAQYNLPL